MNTRLLSSVLTAASVLGVAGCPNQARNDSTAALNEGNTAYGAKQYETAIVAFKRATDRFHDNHLAWYGLGGAQYQRGDFTEAANAFDTAAQLVPDNAMYQMWDGISLYNKQIQQARDEQAKKNGTKPEETQVDLAAVHFDKAQSHLEEAQKLSPDLWQPHYYLGMIDLAGDKPHEAAEQFTKAIEANPREHGAYVELGQLYSRWDYTKEAIQVASQGTANVVGSNESSDIWFTLGMGYDEERLDDKAIEAFTKALESRRDNHKALFQRGQAYFRKGDLANAKKDLGEYSKTGGVGDALNKSQASKMLVDIAAKQAPPPPAPEAPAPKK